jgi:hypothetical protein
MRHLRLRLHPQILVDERHPAIGATRTLILQYIPVRCLKKECGEPLHRLPLYSLRVLRGLYHLDLALLSTNLNDALVGELRKLRLHRLAVRAPICIIHCECIRSRGRAAHVLETEKAISKSGAHGKHHEQNKQRGNKEAKKDEFPVHLYLESRVSFYTAILALNFSIIGYIIILIIFKKIIS